MAIKRYGNEIGVTFFDVATLKFYVGQFNDDEPLSNFRTLVCQIRPVEVLHEREMANSDIIKMLKNTPSVPVFNPLQPKDCWGVIKTYAKIDTFSQGGWSDALLKLKESDSDLAFQSLGMSIAFLEEALLADMTLGTSEFHLYRPETAHNQTHLEYLVLDS